MQTFRIIAKNPSHENAASKLVPAAVRFFILAVLICFKQHSALLYETAVLLFFAVINARMRDDIIPAWGGAGCDGAENEKLCPQGGAVPAGGGSAGAGA